MKYKGLYVTLIITFLVFMLGNAMTATPGRVSGNGNPALLLFLPLFVLFPLLIFQWFKVFRNKPIRPGTTIVLTMLIICHHVIGIYMQIKSFQSYRLLLANVYEAEYGEIDWSYIDSITSGISIHVNNQYFNSNTYLMLVSLSLLIGLVSQIFKTRR